MSSEKYTLVEGGFLIESRLSEDIDESYRLFVDATAVRRSEDDEEKELKARQILRLLDQSNIGNEWTEAYQPTDLEILIGYTPLGYGAIGMSAELNWPKVSDETASLIATQAMRQMAHDLGMYPDRQIPGLVYAQVDRRFGITLETNPAGSCSMDTDGGEYEQDSERVSLVSHNLYTHQMQLICISGLIALAKAR